MRYEPPLIPATLLRRYKRFLADVRLADGTELTVHCPNSGSMKACSEPGRPVMIRDAQNPKRKLRYTWEMIRMGRTWVGIHSALGNPVAADLIARGRIPELVDYDTVHREVKPPTGDKSRLDLLLEAPGRPRCWVEIKFSTMRAGHQAAFPDAVTTRGRRHLEELATLRARGERAVLLYLVGRNDCRALRPADEIDPDYGATLRRAVEQGVEPLAYRMICPSFLEVDSRSTQDNPTRLLSHSQSSLAGCSMYSSGSRATCSR